MDRRDDLLWIGFRTLRGLEEGCLDRKRVSVHTVPSFEAGLARLSNERADIVVLSMTASGRRLVEQVERLRALRGDMFVAVVACNESDAEHARNAGADDVMSLDGDDGELVCAPVLRWVEMRRGANLIDLRAVTRNRRGLEAEVERLRREVSALTRLQVRDPSTGVLGRDSFMLQVELAGELIRDTGRRMHLLLFETGALDLGECEWGDHVVGGIATRIGQVLHELAPVGGIVGRIGPTRFALALTDASDDDTTWVAEIARDRLSAIALPRGGSLELSMCAGRLRRGDSAARLLERIEGDMAANLDATRVLTRRAIGQAV